MGCEQAFADKLVKKFPFLETKTKIARIRRLFVDIEDQTKLHDVVQFLKDDGILQICTMTGLDEGAKFCVIYHFAHEDGTMINLKIWTPRESPSIQTICDIYPGAVFYERELIDLLGIAVDGIPAGRSYPLPEDWPKGQFPLRKDWKPEMLKKKEA